MSTPPTPPMCPLCGPNLNLSQLREWQESSEHVIAGHHQHRQTSCTLRRRLASARVTGRLITCRPAPRCVVALLLTLPCCPCYMQRTHATNPNPNPNPGPHNPPACTTLCLAPTGAYSSSSVLPPHPTPPPCPCKAAVAKDEGGGHFVYILHLETVAKVVETLE